MGLATDMRAMVWSNNHCYILPKDSPHIEQQRLEEAIKSLLAKVKSEVDTLQTRPMHTPLTMVVHTPAAYVEDLCRTDDFSVGKKRPQSAIGERPIANLPSLPLVVPGGFCGIKSQFKFDKSKLFGSMFKVGSASDTSTS